jgi:hypothetical protein
MQPDAMSAIAAAAMLDVDERTIRRAIARGDIKATKRGGVYQTASDDLARYRARLYPDDLPKSRGRSIRPHLVPLPLPASDPASALPNPLTPLIGRDSDVIACSTIVRGDGRAEGARLLTLTGPGGVGKTRLSLVFAEEMSAEFPDGVWFVPLAPVRNSALVAAAIAAVLGVREAGGRPLVAGLQAFLKDRRALLLQDNVEHLLEAAPLVTELLTTCPPLAVLAASR